MTDQVQLQIAVIGAGIAGLTAAIALQKHANIDVHVYERATELREIGATIALGPNGLKTLERLGVSDVLDDSIAFRNKSGRPMIYQTARFYRPHLQRALLNHIEPGRLHLGKAFSSVSRDSSSQGLIVTFTDGTSIATDILLGADGIHSPVRQAFVPTSAAKWSGYLTFRSVFPRSHVQHISDLPDEAVHIWGPDRSLFLSPLAQDLFTIVGSQQSDPEAPDAPYKDSVWNSDGSVDTLRDLYKDWSPLARAVIDATPYTKIYPNTAAKELDSWVLGGGRVSLVGDAAHAHGGAFAAGGSLAIDDAWAFAQAVLHVFPETQRICKPVSDDDVARALSLYERTRKEHTDRVQRTVQQRNGALVSLIDQKETDAELRTRMQSRRDLVWIHEHDVERAFLQAVAAETQRETSRL
ncbi:hypothetical protein VD0002_g3889 [Verticillium dahliae]|uniref:FAD-binding domain-containing protein n=1 Tax=Verticillium dahliae TaxID=27337 RepID=A0AA44WBU6_VERDA|nr:hypothetical protein BJF96_g7941 [Verticillium dahliae]PNH64959.1 hypothetical protein VD0002_g3889 [Verticillium dahliae]